MLKLDDSLKQVAKGTGIAFIGMVLGTLFSFVVRLFIARYGLQTNYGIFSLAMAVLSLASILAGLGLVRGTTWQIAYFRGKEDTAKVRTTIFTSLQLSSIASIVLSLILFFLADTIALNIFHAPELTLPLKIFAIAIPFLTLTQVLVAVHRGFDRIEPMLVFQYLMINVLFLAFLSIAIVIELPFVAVFYAYLASLVITFVASAIYTARRLPQQTNPASMGNTHQITKELLLFSLPLLSVSILQMATSWVDTFVLGYFKTPEIVGLYNAALPLARFISEPMNAMLLIYVPIATGLYSRNLMSELRKSYTVSTKWIMSITLPIFLVLFLFPGAVLKLFFGTGYVPAATALRILSFGFIISNLLGPNGATLIAVGQPRFLMWTMLAVLSLNTALDILLIPVLGIVGAAIASTISLIVMNVIRTIKLYRLCGAQPFNKSLLKPAIICIALAFLIQIIAEHFLTITWWWLMILFAIYLGIYGLATLFTRSFDREDIALLLEIEKRSRLNLAPLKKILKRFV